MTNRRRTAKGKTSTAKKTDSPEKQTRKLNRRSKRNRRSESPEQPDNAESECSGDEGEDQQTKQVDGDKNDTCKESSNLNENKGADEQKSVSKEEESGGSDGSWKVKSENGGGGGIPKLKLCLTRPPEMPSPTSEQSSSPRRRRRSGRGSSTPTKEDQSDENPVEEVSKRVTRNQKIKETSGDIAVEKETEEQEDSKEKVETISESAYNVEEDETRLAIESISNVEQNDNPVAGNQVIEDGSKSMQESEPVKNANEVHEVEKNSEPVPNNVPPSYNEKKQEEGVNKESESQPVSSDQETAGNETNSETKNLPQQAEKEAVSAEQNTVSEHKEERRSSSRDSSEERAKEAALRSRHKKKKEGSEEGEVVESPGGENLRQTETDTKNDESNASCIATKENTEAPAKSGARKRRWGSSTNKTNKKPSVSISTDFLKEIIPEAKPLLMSEVQLSPNDEDEEGQLKDSEESLPMPTKKIEKEKMIQSDESEKDYEEEGVDSGKEEPATSEPVKPKVQPKEKEFNTFTRRVSVMPANDQHQKSPSPPRNKPSNILFIMNLVRPFTIHQLKELLARTGTILEDGFWIDNIKSKCYVKYETEEQAKTTRHALHGVRWPVSNPKQLSVDFGTESAMKAAMEGNEMTVKRSIPSLFDKQIDLKTGEKIREREKERERDRDRDRDKSGDRRDRIDRDKKDRIKHDDKKEDEDDKDKKARPDVEPLVRDRTVRRVTMPIREWDVGKNEDGFSPPPDGVEYSRHRDDRYERRVEYDKDKRDDYEERRRRDRDRGRRSVSGEPPRKSKKKAEEEAPAKLLDDLFRKTKATPCIYWLPLTPEQIAVKEEMRRKHMAEHEKKMSELRKMREQSKRSSDKRRRRTRSRSRSRSAKK